MQEFAEALKEFSPGHEGIQEAQHNVEELEKLKHELEQKRKNQLEESKKHQEGKTVSGVTRGHKRLFVERVCCLFELNCDATTFAFSNCFPY